MCVGGGGPEEGVEERDGCVGGRTRDETVHRHYFIHLWHFRTLLQHFSVVLLRFSRKQTSEQRGTRRSSLLPAFFENDSIQSSELLSHFKEMKLEPAALPTFSVPDDVGGGGGGSYSDYDV